MIKQIKPILKIVTGSNGKYCGYECPAWVREKGVHHGGVAHCKIFGKDLNATITGVVRLKLCKKFEVKWRDENGQ